MKRVMMGTLAVVMLVGMLALPSVAYRDSGDHDKGQQQEECYGEVVKYRVVKQVKKHGKWETAGGRIAFDSGWKLEPVDISDRPGGPWVLDESKKIGHQWFRYHQFTKVKKVKVPCETTTTSTLPEETTTSTTLPEETTTTLVEETTTTLPEETTTTLPEETTTTLPEETTTTLPEETTTTLPEETTTTLPEETTTTLPESIETFWSYDVECGADDGRFHVTVEFGDGISLIGLASQDLYGDVDTDVFASEFTESGQTRSGEVAFPHTFVLVPMVLEGYEAVPESAAFTVDPCPVEVTTTVSETTSTTAVGELPFTGFSPFVLGAVGLALLGLGGAALYSQRKESLGG